MICESTRRGRVKRDERGWMETDEQQIMRLFEDGDRALVAADIDELSRIFSDEYMQYDERGRAFTKQDVLSNLGSGAIRYISMKSTGRSIRFLKDDVAIVRGSEDDEVERGARRFAVCYIYMDVVMKREGKWRIVESQLASSA